MFKSRRKSRLRALGVLCSTAALVVTVLGCGAKQPSQPSSSEIQADLVRTQNDPNIPPVAKEQALREKEQLLRASKKNP